MKIVRACVAVLLTAVVALLVASAAHVAAAPGASDLRVVTTPPIAGAVFLIDGVEHITDGAGEVVVLGAGDLSDISTRLAYLRYEGDPTSDATFTRFYGVGSANRTREVVAQFVKLDEVHFTFVNLDGVPVPYDRIEQTTLKSSVGVVFEFTGRELLDPQMLPSVRTIASPTGLETKALYYTVQSVFIDGTNTVNRSQQKFFPSETDEVAVDTQFFHVIVNVSDAFFGFSTGDAVLVRWPDGEQTRHLVVDGRADLPLLPRGEYEMRVDGPGLVTWRPVSVSRDLVLDLELMSVVDIGAVVAALISIAVGLILIGRRRHRSDVGDPASPDEGESGSSSETPPETPPETSTEQGAGADAPTLAGGS